MLKRIKNKIKIKSPFLRGSKILGYFQYVVIPSRRASASAFQLMASHALGEAGSPYICGLIADAVSKAFVPLKFLQIRNY